MHDQWGMSNLRVIVVGSAEHHAVGRGTLQIARLEVAYDYAVFSQQVFLGEVALSYNEHKKVIATPCEACGTTNLRT